MGLLGGTDVVNSGAEAVSGGHRPAVRLRVALSPNLPPLPKAPYGHRAHGLNPSAASQLAAGRSSPTPSYRRRPRPLSVKVSTAFRTHLPMSGSRSTIERVTWPPDPRWPAELNGTVCQGGVPGRSVTLHPCRREMRSKMILTVRRPRGVRRLTKPLLSMVTFRRPP